MSQEQSDGTTRPIAYASRTLQKHEQNYGITELEGLAVVWAAKHFRHYLYGHSCHIYTDHEALKALLNTPHPSGKLARWGLILQELDVVIHYQPGRKNMKADALSRHPLEPAEANEEEDHRVVAAIDREPAQAGDKPLSTLTLSDRQHQDLQLRPLILFQEKGSLPDDPVEAKVVVASQTQYTLIDGVLYHVKSDGSLRIVPPQGERRVLFDDVHSGAFGAHLGDVKTYSTLSRHYWWPRMRSDIATWSKSCLVCATRYVGKPTKPYLTPIPVGGPFDRVGVDVLQLPKSSKGNQYAVVFIDYLTKWPEVFATRDQTSLTIAKLLVEKIVPRHGVPSQLLSDRGAAFLSGLMQELYHLLGIHKVNTTAYHPQTDGLVERFHRTLVQMLSKTTLRNGRDWDERLPYVLFAYRTSAQASTGESPFFLLYGRDAQLPTEAVLQPTVDCQIIACNDYRGEMATKMKEAWEMASKMIKTSQDRQKKYFDRHAKPRSYKIGERVFIYMPAAKTGPSYKLARPYHGPYRITASHETGIEATPVDRPQDTPIRVALNRVRVCPEEIGNDFYPRSHPPNGTSHVDCSARAGVSVPGWTGRLRSRTGQGQLPDQAGEM